jgi:hypothetical protein
MVFLHMVGVSNPVIEFPESFKPSGVDLSKSKSFRRWGDRCHRVNGFLPKAALGLTPFAAFFFFGTRYERLPRQHYIWCFVFYQGTTGSVLGLTSPKIQQSSKNRPQTIL